MMEALDTKSRIETVNWKAVRRNLNNTGYAIVKKILSKEDCDSLIEGYNDDTLYRKTISMERYQFGKGEYKYYDYPLPAIIQRMRELVYPNIVPVANLWMKVLNRPVSFPEKHTDMLQACQAADQHKPTPLILNYSEGGFNTLHQDLYGDVFFPIQAVFFLSESGKDYQGGEFVMTEQRPRAQSKAIVLNPMQGDMLLFTTNFRPVKGTRGYYQVKMKHGVSEVKDGKRFTLGVIFHDAK